MILKTNRLQIREFTLSDYSFIIELLNTDGWLQYIGNKNIKTKEQAIEYLKNIPLKNYKEHGFGLWMLEKFEDNTPIGMCGFIKRDYLENIDLGFAILPQFEGMGYISEAAKACIEYGKEYLQITNLDAITTPDNRKSQKLLINLGFSYLKKIRIGDNSEELNLYRLAL
jgi:RimJ/RimL family protein N-acetyltransferase